MRPWLRFSPRPVGPWHAGITGGARVRRRTRVEFRNGKFVLVDFSSNGTFLRVDGERDVVPHREAAPLRGSGWIFLGAAPERPEPGHAVRYCCA